MDTSRDLVVSHVYRHCLLGKVGRLEGLKVGRLEGWNVERLEGSKDGRSEGWKVQVMKGYSKVSRNSETTKSLGVFKEFGQFSCF